LWDQRQQSAEESRNYLAVNAIQAFYKALRGDHSERTALLYRQWAEQFSEVHGAFGDNRRFDTDTLRRSYGFRRRDQVDLLPFFFALETYFTLLMKFLAYQVVGYYLDRKMGLPLADWEKFGSERLREEVTELDSGGIFRERKIRNFIEGDLFGWYLSDWEEPIENAVRELIRRLNEYDPESLEVEPEYTRDLLKQLYQYLIPPQIRHDLGEYYTPDWLAECVLNRLDYGPKRKDLLDLRVLDPGCGSGTFLVLAIKRAIAHGRQYGTRPEVLLGKIINNIQGFDLNPVAVIAARTNYLLALADLLPYKSKLPGGELTTPVYLCDSINPPRAEVEDEGSLYAGQPQYYFRTSVGLFRFAEPVVKRERLQRLTPILGECVKRQVSTDRFIRRLREELGLSQGEWDASQESLRETYEKLVDLEKRGINGIWANILKNAFAPLFAGQFDLIAGNPPWINWEALPQHYRDATKRFWVDYGLFSLRGHAARLGGGKKDLSMLFVYVALDRYLRKSGHLAFVITQTVFKTKGAGDGFRRFRLGEGGTLFGVEQVDDMVELQPFELATNRTAVFSCRKNAAQKYPVPYLLWRKKHTGRIVSNSTFPEVLNITNRFDLRAQPVSDEERSPWMCARNNALDALKSVMKQAEYRAYEGANCGGANGVFWVNLAGRQGQSLLVENMNDVGRREIEAVRMAIESTLVYPLARGRDVTRWLCRPSAHIVVTQDPETRGGRTEKWLQEYAPKTLKYMKRFESVLWERRSGSVRALMERYGFWSMFAIGEYTFAPTKVVWKYISTELECAVVDHAAVTETECKTVVPDCKLILIPCSSPAEAHYICACLNSAPARLVVKGYCISTQLAPHIMQRIGIPRFDPQSNTHQELSEASVQCHNKTAVGVSVVEQEEQVDNLAAELWGLTAQEMKALRESLEILSPPRRRRARAGEVEEDSDA
jgi:hypothetical protein